MTKRATEHHAKRPVAARAQADEVSSVAQQLLDTARQQLALHGARALGLRRLAAAAGVTLATLSYHLGSKSNLLQALVQAEQARDHAWHQAWLARVARVVRWDASTLAVFVEHYLDDACAEEKDGGGAQSSLIWSDLMLHAGVDEATAVLLEPWLEQRRAFWRQLLDGRMEDAAWWAEALHAYVSDECVHALAIGRLADYRLLRRMAIERLLQGLDAGSRQGPGNDTAVFETLVQRMNPSLGLVAPGSTSALLEPGRYRDIATAACEVILEEGAQALTHRAVAERVGIPASSVAYHCRRGEDLLLAGQEMVYLVAQGRMPAPRDDSPEQRLRVTMRGTLSISLAAARNPSLHLQAIDLRRLRGENLTRLLQGGAWPAADRLDGQTAAIVGLGAMALAGAGRRPAQDVQRLMGWLLPGFAFL